MPTREKVINAASVYYNKLNKTETFNLANALDTLKSHIENITHYKQSHNQETGEQETDKEIAYILGHLYEKAGDLSFSLSEDVHRGDVQRLNDISLAFDYYQSSREAFYQQDEPYNIESLYISMQNTLEQKTKLSGISKYARQMLSFANNSNYSFFLEETVGEDNQKTLRPIVPKAEGHNLYDLFQGSTTPHNQIEFLDGIIFATTKLGHVLESAQFAIELCSIFEALPEEDQANPYLKDTYARMQPLLRILPTLEAMSKTPGFWLTDTTQTTPTEPQQTTQSTLADNTQINASTERTMTIAGPC